LQHNCNGRQRQMRNGQGNGSAIVIGDSGGDGRQWQQWATAGVTMGDSDSGGMIPMAVNGGGAMEGRAAATA
jgi:hypothetical protein